MKSYRKNNGSKSAMHRRDFLQLVTMASLAVAALPSWINKSKEANASSLGTRKLGSLEVSAIGLGCMSMNSGNYNPPKDKHEMIRLIHKAVDSGVTLFDTAEAYGPFINEELVGEALLPYRKRIVITTKFGFGIDYATGKRGGPLNSKPEHIRQVVEVH